MRPRTYPGASKWLVGKMETKSEGSPQSWNLPNKPWPLNRFTEIKKYKERNWVHVRTAKILNFVLKHLPAGEAFSSSTWNSSFRRDKDVPSPWHRAEILRVGRQSAKPSCQTHFRAVWVPQAPTQSSTEHSSCYLKLRQPTAALWEQDSSFVIFNDSKAHQIINTIEKHTIVRDV